jgi:nucleoside triphosphatase
MSEVALESDFLGAFGVLERDGGVLLAQNRRVLVPGSAARAVYDLPGGRVEPGETLEEALGREWREECGIEPRRPRFLFVQEGVRHVEGRRRYAWRSFFFAVEADAEPRPGHEVEALLWCPRAKLDVVLDAPYHAGFKRWLRDGEALQRDVWA